MCVIHDTKDAVPNNLAKLLNYAGASCGPFWASQEISETRTMLGTQARNGRLVRSGTLPVGESYMDFDYGYLLLATDNAAANTPAGLVWVDIDVEFFLPVQ
jgi:hypothetical protein